MCRLSVIFVYDEKQSRLSRVLLIVTGIITIMFCNAALNAQVRYAHISTYTDAHPQTHEHNLRTYMLARTHSNTPTKAVHPS